MTKNIAIFIALVSAQVAVAAPTITIAPAPPDRVAVRITGTPGASYALEASLNPNGPWMAVISGKFNGPVTLLDTKNGRRFYRVKEQP